MRWKRLSTRPSATSISWFSTVLLPSSSWHAMHVPNSRREYESAAAAHLHVVMRLPSTVSKIKLFRKNRRRWLDGLATYCYLSLVANNKGAICCALHKEEEIHSTKRERAFSSNLMVELDTLLRRLRRLIHAFINVSVLKFYKRRAPVCSGSNYSSLPDRKRK